MRWKPSGREDADGGRASPTSASPVALRARRALPAAVVEAKSLTRLTNGSPSDDENGMRSLPPAVRMTSELTSANCASMRCSRHSCRTDRRVYLKSGTSRTLRMSSRWRLPWASLATTGMSPISVALYSRPSAALKRSEQGRVLTSASGIGVREPEQPESACARMSTEARALWKARETVVAEQGEGADLPRVAGSSSEAMRQPPFPSGSHCPR
jgi:hypothetical protein